MQYGFLEEGNSGDTVHFDPAQVGHAIDNSSGQPQPAGIEDLFIDSEAEPSERLLHYLCFGLSKSGEFPVAVASASVSLLDHDHQTEILHDRIRAGWTTEEVLTTEVRKNKVGEKIYFNGESHTISEWADITGITQKAISDRLIRGFTVEKVLTQPLQKRKKVNYEEEY